MIAESEKKYASEREKRKVHEARGIHIAGLASVQNLL